MQPVGLAGIFANSSRTQNELTKTARQIEDVRFAEVFGPGSMRADMQQWMQRLLAGGPAVWAAGGAAAGALVVALVIWAWPKRDAPGTDAAGTPVKATAANTATAAPATSGNDELEDVMVGAPQAIASRTGIPKPSYREGKTKTSAQA